MDDANKILIEQIKKLPKPLADYVISGVWAKELSGALSTYNLDENQKAAIENELLLSLVGLEPLLDLPENIKGEANLDDETTWEIVEGVILKILEESGLGEKFPNENNPEIRNKKTNGVGESFEQIILNQARAMQPAREPGEVPPDLPSEKEKTETASRPQPQTGAIHNYLPGQDPYRELPE